MLTGKKSLIDRSATSLYSYVGDTTKILSLFEQPESWKAPNRDTNLVRGIPFEYEDLYGKLTLLTGNGSKLNLFGFQPVELIKVLLAFFLASYLADRGRALSRTQTATRTISHRR